MSSTFFFPLSVDQVDLTTVAGSGPLGRIVAADVEAAAGKAPAPVAAAPAPTPAPAVTSAPAPAAPKPAQPAQTIVPGTVVPFTGMQAAVTKNMNASLEVPTFHVGYTITTDNLDKLYKKVCIS